MASLPFHQTKLGMLPLEIRNKIYDYALQYDGKKRLWWIEIGDKHCPTSFLIRHNSTYTPLFPSLLSLLATCKSIYMESYSFFYSTQKILISGKDFKEFSKTVSHARRVEIKKLHVVVELDFNPDELIKLVDTYHGLVNVKITILPLVHSHSTFRRQTHTYDDKGKIDKTAMVEFKRDKEECGAEALVAMLGAVIQKHRPSDQNLDLFANMGSESRVAEYDAGMKGMKSEEREETERKGG